MFFCSSFFNPGAPGRRVFALFCSFVLAVGEEKKTVLLSPHNYLSLSLSHSLSLFRQKKREMLTTRSASSGAVASTSASSSRGVNNRRARFLSSSLRKFPQLLILKSGGSAPKNEENYPLPPSCSRRGHFSVPCSASASSNHHGGSSFENEENEIFFPIAPGRRSDGKRNKKTEIHAISEPRKPSSANEGTKKTGSATTRAKSSSHGGKKKSSSSSSSNKRSPPNGQSSPNGGGGSSSHYKPFTPTSLKVSNVRRKKFAPLIAGVADNVPLDELLEKYPNFADCLGPKKYDSGHFI